jgi:20S proteasome subunit alpha 7
MASSGSGYDLSSSTFSPDGRIFQVEYATKAVENAGTVLGILVKGGGVVLGAAKPLLHKMLVPSSSPRIHSVAEHVGVAMTGQVPDARVVVSRARDESSGWLESYGTPVPPHVLADRVGSYVHYFTLHGSLRPFGAAVLLGGYDVETKDYSLHMVEPNGCAYRYYAVAAGKGRQAAKTELEKLLLHTNAPTISTPREACQQICKILHMLHDDAKDKPFELELSWICAESNNKHVGVPKDIVKDSVAWAKQQLEDDDDDAEEVMEE